MRANILLPSRSVKEILPGNQKIRLNPRDWNDFDKGVD